MIPNPSTIASLATLASTESLPPSLTLDDPFDRRALDDWSFLDASDVELVASDDENVDALDDEPDDTIREERPPIWQAP